MSLIISGDLLGAKGSEDKLYLIKDKKVIGVLSCEDFFKTAGEKDVKRLIGIDAVIANQALESYITKCGGNLPEGLVISTEVRGKIDFMKQKPIPKVEDKSKKIKIEVKTEKKFKVTTTASRVSGFNRPKISSLKEKKQTYGYTRSSLKTPKKIAEKDEKNDNGEKDT